MGSICVSLMLSCSVFLYFSSPHLALPSSPPTSVLCFSLSLFPPLSAVRSTALLASGNAVRSPLSLCDGGMACGVKGR